jgi:hypothetical protein
VVLQRKLLWELEIQSATNSFGFRPQRIWRRRGGGIDGTTTKKGRRTFARPVSFAFYEVTADFPSTSRVGVVELVAKLRIGAFHHSPRQAFDFRSLQRRSTPLGQSRCRLDAVVHSGRF